MSALLLRAWMFLRRNLWVRRFEELHIEAAYSDVAFKKLLQYANKHPATFLMLSCPLQDEWQRLRIQAESVEENLYQSILKKRYQIIAKLPNPIGVHVHLFGPYSVAVPNYAAQYKLISEAKAYFEDLELPTFDFAPGWNRYNSDTVKVCENLGFKCFHVSQLKNGFEHSSTLKFKMVYNVNHDWGLK